MSMYKSALYLRQDLLTMYVEYIAWVIIHWWKLISGIFSQIYILYKNLDVSWNCIFACIIFFQLKFLFLLLNFNSYIAHIIFKFFSLFLLLFYFFCSIFKHLFKLINNYNFLKIYKTFQEKNTPIC